MVLRANSLKMIRVLLPTVVYFVFYPFIVDNDKIHGKNSCAALLMYLRRYFGFECVASRATLLDHVIDAPSTPD